MDIEKQLDVLKKKHADMHRRFLKPIEDRINELEKVREDLKNQIAINYDTEERTEQLNRIINFNNEF